MILTDHEIRIEANKYNKSLSKHPMSVRELTEVLVDFAARLQNLQQNNVKGTLELLEHELKRLENITDRYMPNMPDFVGAEINRVKSAIQLINELEEKLK